MKVPIAAMMGRGVIAAIGSFENIESFAIEHNNYNVEIDQTLIRLPKLQHLYIKLRQIDSFEFILELLRQCQTIKKIVFDIEHLRFGNEVPFMRTFFDKFPATINNHNVIIELQKKAQSIGSITKDKIILRNKLR